MAMVHMRDPALALGVAVPMLRLCPLLAVTVAVLSSIAVVVAATRTRVLVRVGVRLLGMTVLSVTVLMLNLFLRVVPLAVAVLFRATAVSRVRMLVIVRLLGMPVLSVPVLIVLMAELGRLLRECSLQCRHSLRLRNLGHRLEYLGTSRRCIILSDG